MEDSGLTFFYIFICLFWLGIVFFFFPQWKRLDNYTTAIKKKKKSLVVISFLPCLYLFVHCSVADYPCSGNLSCLELFARGRVRK